MPAARWIGPSRSTRLVNHAHQHGTNLSRTAGVPSNYVNLFAEREDHAIGPSRGGLSTKIHALVDGIGRPLVLLVTPGQGATHRC